MRALVIIQFNSHIDSEEVWDTLTRLGCDCLYSSCDEQFLQICCQLPLEVTQSEIKKLCPEVLSITQSAPLEIDWEAQWAAHAPGYREGYLYVDVGTVSRSVVDLPPLRLKPGPGFGDLSHPTTRLVLQLMSQQVKAKNILDVGCGSGVLSLVAVVMGADSVCGIDIDDEALIHSRHNALLNRINISFMRPDQYCKAASQSKDLVLLMNMIQSEQVVAWNSLLSIHPRVATVITSGVLISNREDYIKLCNSWGWELTSEVEEGEWGAYCFKNSRNR